MRISSMGDLGASITIPSTMIDAVVDKAVAAATPQVVALLQQEKEILKDAVVKALPFAGGSVAIFLGTLFLVPGDRTIFKVIGYLVSAGLLGGSILMLISSINTASAPTTAAAVNQPSSYKIDFSL
jgi:hypothetical protein